MYVPVCLSNSPQDELVQAKARYEEKMDREEELIRSAKENYLHAENNLESEQQRFEVEAEDLRQKVELASQVVVSAFFFHAFRMPSPLPKLTTHAVGGFCSRNKSKR